MMQVWFSENKPPIFTQEDKDTYSVLVENQFYPIGNYNGRRMLRCQTTDFKPIYEFLANMGKDPYIIGIRNEQGEWCDIDGVVTGFKDQYAFDSFMQPYVDAEGNIVYPPDNTSGGWLAFNEDIINV